MNLALRGMKAAQRTRSAPMMRTFLRPQPQVSQKTQKLISSTAHLSSSSCMKMNRNINNINNHIQIPKSSSLNTPRPLSCTLVPRATRPFMGMQMRQCASASHTMSRRRYGISEFYEKGGIVIQPKNQVTQLKKDVRLTGRSWRANELRLKSFWDLHSIWHVLIKERNLVLTEKELTSKRSLRRRFLGLRLMKVRKSMARIKLVLTERQKMQTYLDYHGHLLPTTEKGWKEIDSLREKGRDLTDFGVNDETVKVRTDLIDHYRLYRLNHFKGPAPNLRKFLDKTPQGLFPIVVGDAEIQTN